MQEVIARMTHMNFEATLAVMLLGCVEVLLGVAVYKKIEGNKEIEDKIFSFVDDYVLELLVRIPITPLQNKICSYRLGDRDIKIMSRKGYKIFDGDKGRFVREIPEALKLRI